MFAEYQKNETALEKTISNVKRISDIEGLTSRKNNELPLVVQLLTDGQEFEAEEATLELTSKQFQAAQDVQIKHIVQLRQNTDEGSTLEVSYNLKGTGLSYVTAANLAVFPKNSD